MLVADFSSSDQELAVRLAAATGDDVVDPASYALMARLLKDDRAVTPDADLSALLTALEQEERSSGYARQEELHPNRQKGMQSSSVEVQVKRNATGGAGFAFDRENLCITARPKDATKLREMRVGDLIVAVNGQQVKTCAEYREIALGFPNFTLTLRRPGAQVSAPPCPSRAVPRATANGAGAGVRQSSRQAQTRHDEWEAMAMDIDNMSYEELLAWEQRQGVVVQPGLADSVLDRLPVEHICGGGDECGICLEDFCDGEGIVRLPCLHRFHVSCGRDWLTRQARCPFCNCEVKL